MSTFLKNPWYNRETWNIDSLFEHFFNIHICGQIISVVNQTVTYTLSLFSHL